MNKKTRRAFQSVKGGSRNSLWKAMEEAKGLTAESSVLSALLTIKPDWLVEARKADLSEDRSGIDIYLKYKSGKYILDIPIQVKSSQKGLQNHIKIRKKKGGRFIPCVIVQSSDSPQKICENVQFTIRFYIQGKAKHQRHLKRLKNKSKHHNS